MESTELIRGTCMVLHACLKKSKGIRGKEYFVLEDKFCPCLSFPKIMDLLTVCFPFFPSAYQEAELSMVV